jgi:hypothetical protein
MDFIRDMTQTDRAMVYGVQSCHVSEKCLARANIAGGLLSADMLFASFDISTLIYSS